MQSALKKLADVGGDREEAIPLVSLKTFYSDFKGYAGQVYSHETVVVYDRAFTKFIEHCGNRMLGTISPRHIDTYKAKRLKDISPVTVNIELRTLHLKDSALRLSHSSSPPPITAAALLSFQSYSVNRVGV